VTMIKRINRIRDAERKIVHRVWEGVKGLPPKEMAAFIIQNLAQGFAQGLVKELKKKLSIFLYLHEANNLNWFRNPALSLIAFGTDSKFIHVGIKYDDRLICEATGKRGVDFRPLSHYKKLVKKEKRVIHIYECLEPIKERGFYDWLVEQNDRKYNFLGVVRLAWLKISLQRGRANKYQESKDYFCSALVLTGLRMYSLNQSPFPDIPISSVASPADIVRSKSFKEIGLVK